MEARHYCTAKDLTDRAYALYDSLPASGKPNRSNAEYTTLCCIFLSSLQTGSTLISLATGSQCSPLQNEGGRRVKDWHAEVLAKRGLQLWLCCNMDSDLLKDPTMQVDLVISHLPCGDASLGQLARSQTAEVKQRYAAMDGLANVVEGEVLRGRNNFEAVGFLRTKPARSDAETTTSHSCSDKLALWCAMGMQGSILSRRIQSNLRPKRIIIACSNLEACETNTSLLRSNNSDINVIPVTSTFAHGDGDRTCPSAISWILDMGVEVLVQGVKRGAPSNKTPLPESACSRVCKLSLARRYKDMSFEGDSYADMKMRSDRYMEEKASLISSGKLKGWIRSDKDYEVFSLELVQPLKRKREHPRDQSEV